MMMVSLLKNKIYFWKLKFSQKCKHTFPLSCCMSFSTFIITFYHDGSDDNIDGDDGFVFIYFWQVWRRSKHILPLVASLYVICTFQDDHDDDHDQ